MLEAQPLSALACSLGAFVLIIVVTLTIAIRIVPEYRRLAVYRLGRYLGELGPGLVLLIPLIDRGIMVDVRDEAARAQAYQEMGGSIGETRSYVDSKEGLVEFEGKTWRAVSQETLPPGTRVRVARVILEVERLQPK
jgi:membrane protein implicated in regulation of membrane protease activity